MLESMSLTGRRALVTGASRGIGLGMAKGLAQAGATVSIVGRDEGRNAEALAELEKLRPGCRGFCFDLEDLDAIDAFYRDASRQVGGFDILINNAGLTIRGRADELSLEDWHRVLRVDLTAPFALSQSFARERIAAGKGGSIIMTASLMSEASRPTTAAYTAAKGGIRQLVRALAVDWAPFNIRVNGIGPGYISTELTRALWENAEFDAWVKKRTPLGRWGTPADFEGAAVFLASDAAAFVTGQVLYVDGGWLATF